MVEALMMGGSVKSIKISETPTTFDIQTDATGSVTSDSNSFQVELQDYGVVDCIIDWGDGSTDIYKTAQTALHTYATAGTYTVTLSGQVSLKFSTDSDKLIDFKAFGDTEWQSCNSMFLYCGNTAFSFTDVPDLTSVTSMSNMFSYASSFNQNITDWDVSSVTNMSNMFNNASSFNQELLYWNVYNVTSMYGMFSGATSFNQSLAYWHVEHVGSFMMMFSGATSFNQNITYWDVSSAYEMYGMFYNAEAYTNHDMSDWSVSNVGSHSDFLTGAGSGNTEPLWD